MVCFSMPVKLRIAAEAMSAYLWRLGQCSQIRFILPRLKEIEDSRMALTTWSGFKFDYDVQVINDEFSTAEAIDMRCRVKSQSFNPDSRSLFALSTPGIAEDGWAIYINGLVDSGLVVNLDEHGFLHVVPASAVSKTQRRGRTGRIADGVYCCLTESSSEESASLS